MLARGETIYPQKGFVASGKLGDRAGRSLEVRS